MSTIPPFTEELKYSWPLNRDSLVIDVGSYEGNFSRLIAEKFGCQIWAFEPVFHEQVSALMLPKTTVFPAALGAAQSVEEYGVKGDSTGAYATSLERRQVTVLPVSLMYNLSHVGLIKLNCEGAEFEILEQIIRDGKICIFDGIMVQFHHVVPQSEARRENILIALEQTHDVIWSSPWCWEAWSIKR